MWYLWKITNNEATWGAETNYPLHVSFSVIVSDSEGSILHHAYRQKSLRIDPSFLPMIS